MNHAINLSKKCNQLDLKFQTLLDKGTLLRQKDLGKVENISVPNGMLRTALKGIIERSKMRIENNMARLDILEEKAEFGGALSPPSGDFARLDSRMKALEQEFLRDRSADGDAIGLFSLGFVLKGS